MDEIWERAVVTALDGQTNVASVRTLTLDGAVKCAHGRLPPHSIFEKFQDLHHLSIANIGLASLEQFPRLPNLQKLILSDNRISGGLELLVEAGLESLRDLDLSNNRIQDINDLRPLAELKLVSLDLYECPVTRVKDYRSMVFSLIKSLKYLDKMDADENERPDSDEDDDDEDEDDDPGSGEVDGEEHEYPCRLNNGNSSGIDVIVDVDEDEESDADEEETETLKGTSRSSQKSNGVAEEDYDDEDDTYSMDEIDEIDSEDDDDVIEVHDVVDGDEEEGIDDERSLGLPESTGRLTSTEGEIDGYEQGEEDPDDDGDTGEEHDEGVYLEEDNKDGEEEEEDYGEGYLVQPVGQAENKVEQVGKKDEVDVEVQALPPSSKRKRDDKEDDEEKHNVLCVDSPTNHPFNEVVLY